MRHEPTTGSVLRTHLVLLCAGAGSGLLLARVLGDGSPGALVTGAVTLPAALGIGLAAWGGVAKVWIVAKLWGALRRPEAATDPKAAVLAQLAELRADGALPGSWVFLPAGILAGLGGGAVLALVSGGGVLVAAVTYGAAGFLFGALSMKLARQGRILPGEPA